ncbi:MAG: hypothetical protein ACJ71P_16935 [Nitrososphaeraceae archaeon]
MLAAIVANPTERRLWWYLYRRERQRLNNDDPLSGCPTSSVIVSINHASSFGHIRNVLVLSVFYLFKLG